MRTIQSFILRLLVDADQPDALHGSLRCVSDGTEQSFTDEKMLIALLRRWVNRSATPPIKNTSTGEPHEP
jgi:hypothetical protein